MEKSRIDWTDSTWNPVTGCYHGCKYCYARRMAERFGSGWQNISNKELHELEVPMFGQGLKKGGEVKVAVQPYPYGFTPTIYRYRLDQPKGWKKGRKIFVCSMADLFGDWVPDKWIKEIFDSCRAAPQHKYLFLTKNPKRYIELEKSGLFPRQDNMWFGSSVATRRDTYAWIDNATAKAHYFLSVEPILEPFGKMSGSGIKPEWLIVGAETGNRKGKVVPERWWIEELAEECRKRGIALFMKSSLATIWGEGLVQEYPAGLQK